MFKLFRAFLLILFLASTTTAVYSETSWISKKTDKTKVELEKEKKEKKEKKKKWIAKKKKNKKKFKEKVKKISKKAKSWITKKNKKTDYINSMESISHADLYIAAQDNRGNIYFGYANDDRGSKIITTSTGYSFNSITKGKLFIKNKNVICRLVIEKNFNKKKNKIEGDFTANCDNETKFTTINVEDETKGKFNIEDNSGVAVSNLDESNKLNFHINSERKIAKLKLDAYDKDDTSIATALMPMPREGGGTTKGGGDLKPIGKYYALIIANSDYDDEDTWSDLKSPSKDSKAIKKILINQYKFEDVWLIENADRNTMYEEIDKLSNVVKPDDYLLIYYSGHGKEFKNNQKVYWIPVDAHQKPFSWVSTNDIKMQLADINAQHILILIDSCFGGAFGKSSTTEQKKFDTENLKIKDAWENVARLFIASGGDYSVPDADDPNGYSLFAATIIDILENNKQNITSWDLFGKLRDSFIVKEKSEKPVRVELDFAGTNLKHFGGDFVFHVPKS